MKPINSRVFGRQAGNAPRIAIKFYNGTSVVTGWIVKQLGTSRFSITDGTTTKVARLAQTASELTALTAGTGMDAALRSDLCTVECTPFGGSTSNCKIIRTNKVTILDGTTLNYKVGTAATATGAATVTVVVNNAPTVANAIPDAAFTVAAGWTFVVPANTFADLNADTLTYTATKGDNSALPAQMAFNATTRTFTVAPASGIATGTVAIKVTASDGTASVSDTFDAVIS